MYLKLLKYLTLFLVVLLSQADACCEVIKIENSHPCWSKPAPSRQPDHILTPGTQIHTTGIRTYYIIKSGSLYNRAMMVQFRINNNELWYCPNIYLFQTQSGQQGIKIIPDNSMPDIIYKLSIIAAIVCLLSFLVMKHEKLHEYWTEYQHWWMLAVLLTFHFLWIGYFISNTAEWGHLPLDETGDFFDAKLLMEGKINVLFKRNLGMALFFTPIIWVTDAKNIYDIAPIVSWLMTLIIAPLGIAGAFFFIKKLSKSSWSAFIAMIVILLLPKIYLPSELNSKSVFWLYFLNPERYILTCYNQILNGFNSMSSTLAATLIFFTLVSALYLKSKKVRYITVSGLFAVTCLVRVDYIFISPLIAYLFWKNDDRLLRDLAYTVKTVIMTLAVFILIYSPQLILNKIQSGGFFIYPYAHYTDGAGDGFELSKLSKITHYMMHIHYLYYAVFVFSCFLIKDSFKRNILVLWVVPMTIFFCGFWLGQPFRFLLAIFPGTIAATVILFNEMKESGSSKKFLATLGALLAILAFPELPIYAIKKTTTYFSVISNIRLYAAPFLCIICALICWKQKQWQCLYTVILLGFVFLCSSSWVLLGMMVLLLGWTAFDFARDIIITIKKTCKTIRCNSLDESVPQKDVR